MMKKAQMHTTMSYEIYNETCQREIRNHAKMSLKSSVMKQLGESSTVKMFYSDFKTVTWSTVKECANDNT